MKGNFRSRLPVALKIALPIVGGTGIMPVSPNDFGPYGILDISEYDLYLRNGGLIWQSIIKETESLRQSRNFGLSANSRKAPFRFPL